MMSKTPLLPLLLSLATATACGGSGKARVEGRSNITVNVGPSAGEQTAPMAVLESRSLLDHEDAVGLSGSCARDGYQWFVAERKYALLRYDPASGDIQSHPIEGVPEHIDLEGLACANGRFYVSTEQDQLDRSKDAVLIVDIRGDRAVVVDTLYMSYPDEAKAGVNQGLEALCLAGSYLVAATEQIATDTRGRRKALVLTQHLDGGDTKSRWLHLSSDTGKISGMDCRMNGDTLELFAIERHYEVGRILHVRVGDSEELEPTTILDLAELIRDSENFEAIVVEDNGRVRLSNDNHYKTVTGPSEETLLEPFPAFAL